jgi:hypothetical protein
MTTSAAIRVISRVREAGGYFAVVNGSLRLRNAKRVAPELRAEIATHREGILAKLTQADRKTPPPAQMTLLDYARETLPTIAQVKAERAADPWLTDARIDVRLDDPEACVNGGHHAPQGIGEPCPTCNALHAAIARLGPLPQPQRPSNTNHGPCARCPRIALLDDQGTCEHCRAGIQDDL